MPLAFEGRVSTDEGRHIALPNAGRTLLVVFPRWDHAHGICGSRLKMVIGIPAKTCGRPMVSHSEHGLHCLHSVTFMVGFPHLG